MFIIVYLDDILIYTKNERSNYVEAVRWVLKQLQKYFLYANLKKCHFYLKKLQFLGFVVLLQEIYMEDNRIITIYNLPKLQSV